MMQTNVFAKLTCGVFKMSSYMKKRLNISESCSKHLHPLQDCTCSNRDSSLRIFSVLSHVTYSEIDFCLWHTYKRSISVTLKISISFAKSDRTLDDALCVSHTISSTYFHDCGKPHCNKLSSESTIHQKDYIWMSVTVPSTSVPF